MAIQNEQNLFAFSSADRATRMSKQRALPLHRTSPRRRVGTGPRRYGFASSLAERPGKAPTPPGRPPESRTSIEALTSRSVRLCPLSDSIFPR